MTAGTEACLIALCAMSDDQRRGLKMRALAGAAGVSANTARRAVRALSEMDLITASRPRQGGIDAVYTYEIKQRGHNVASLLKAVYA